MGLHDLPLVDKEICAGISSGKTKTKRKHIPRPIHTNEVPVENARVSAIDMFSARGLATFLKVQVDISKELENNYTEYPGYDETFEDPITDERGCP